MLLPNGKSGMPSIILIYACCVVLLGCEGCEENNNPYFPPLFTFDLKFHNNHPPQADINENVPLEGWLTDRDSVQHSGYKVRFWVDPDSVGRVVPSGRRNLDLQSPTGFDIDVYFIGERYGTALITGQVETDEGDKVAADTLHIVVTEPGNEE